MNTRRTKKSGRARRKIKTFENLPIELKQSTAIVVREFVVHYREGLSYAEVVRIFKRMAKCFQSKHGISHAIMVQKMLQYFEMWYTEQDFEIPATVPDIEDSQAEYLMDFYPNNWEGTLQELLT